MKMEIESESVIVKNRVSCSGSFAAICSLPMQFGYDRRDCKDPYAKKVQERMALLESDFSGRNGYTWDVDDVSRSGIYVVDANARRSEVG